MWRWEVVSIELLPEGVTSKVKKARAARKKLLSHYSATVKLVSALQDAEKPVQDKSLPNLDTILAKISQNEEKVLKFEREAEKQRLTEQAKKMKAQEVVSKKEEKEVAEKEKRLEKERKKQEATKARKEAKRQKEEEKEIQKRLDLETLDQKQARLKKQRDCMKSFFTANTKPAHQKSDVAIPKEDHTTEAPEIKASVDSCEVFDFRTVLNSETGLIANRPFAILSSQARESRKRRVQQVPVSVYVTVIPDNCFDAQPFAERTVVQVRNKYRFLSFHEDCRPPYHGTWSKTSWVITGRHPFSKDDTDLDYEVDSEGEWEEGDDEIGDDVDDEEKNKEEEADEEEGDCREYNYEDGFCVADQDYLAIDEDVDEETKMLYKKKFQNIDKEPQQNAFVPNRVCIVAPLFGGIPMSKQVECHADLIEGLNVQEASDLLRSHQGRTLLDVDLCLDAFPPPIVDEPDATPDISATTQKDEYSVEEMKTLAHFVHHCTLNSKEKVIEELRNQYASVFSSRAKATRKLDSIAIKRRREATNGVYWEVKKEILEQLGLEELLVSMNF
jgi:chromatin assembly factor 1 subunit A